MAAPKTKDWWARGLGIAGLVLGLASFGWQVHTYRDSFAERVLVRLTMLAEIRGDESIEDAMKQEGGLAAEIVNIGQHPHYLRTVSLALEPEREFGPEDPRAWLFSPDNSKTPALEPRLQTTVSTASTLESIRWTQRRTPLQERKLCRDCGVQRR
jgi:hypothetical protein